MHHIFVYPPATTVFPGLEPGFDSFCSLVRSLSRTDTLFWCARLNLLLSNPNSREGIDLQRWALTRFFNSEEIQRIEAFVRTRPGGAASVLVFTRAQLLELFRWTCILAEDHDDDGTTFNDPRVRRRFVQAALLASEVWSDRVYSGGLPESGDLRADRAAAVATLRQAIGDSSPGLELQCALSRWTAIYEGRFCESYPEFAREFVAHTGLEPEIYPLCFTAFMLNFCNVTLANVDEQGGLFKPATVAATASDATARHIASFLAHEMQSPNDLRAVLMPDGVLPSPMSPFDQRPLRERPILHTADGRAIIIDPRYFTEKVVVGPLFMLAKKYRGDSGRVNRLFAAFGDGFEGYAHDLLGSWGRQADVFLANPMRRTRAGEVEVADVAIRFGPDLALLETKGVFLRDSTMSAGDAQPYISQLHDKYVGATHEAARPKGVGQLARTVRFILSDHHLIVPGDLDAVARIFPVLVAYDALLATPGHIEVLGKAFVDKLELDECTESGGDGYIQHGRFLIAPLVVITVEDLEALESSVENFSIVDFLTDYCTHGSEGTRPSVRGFMVATQDRYRFIHSRRLADHCLTKLEAMRPFLRPNDGDTS